MMVEATPLVVEKLRARVSGVQGLRPARSAAPVHRSMTVSPRNFTVSAPPPGPRPTMRSKARRTGSNPGAVFPLTATSPRLKNVCRGPTPRPSPPSALIRTGRVSLEAMTIAAQPLFTFDDSFVRDLDGLYEPWQATPVPAPRLLMLNEELAIELDANPEWLRAPDGVAVLAGNIVPERSTPVAQAYAGHQFGAFSPRLGDGRALLLGEVVDVHGRRRDVHLKGSGRTPYARNGDGLAAIGPMLREHLVSEAMHALGVPSTRSLA